LRALIRTSPHIPPPWPSECSEPHRLAESLTRAHMILSAIAFAATPFPTRRWPVVLALRLEIAVLAFPMFLMAFDLIIAKTGMYL